MYKVMIVDDEPLIREGLQTLIPWQELGFHIVDVAKDGKNAIAKYKQHQLDLMIVDIRMPSMDGLQVIETIRKTDPYIHFLILSGYADFEYAKRAIVCNVDGYIVKPVDETELKEDLKKVKAALDADERLKKRDQAWLADYAVSTAEEEDKTFDLQAAADKLYYAIDIGNESAVKTILSQTMCQMVRDEQSEYAMKTGCVQLLTAVLNKLSLSHPQLKKELDEALRKSVYIYDQTSVKGLEAWMYRIVEQFMQQLVFSNNDTIVKQMIDLIRRNYNENLKLEILAETFNYNSAYLGRLFKSFTGEHFNTYLDKVRIERAKELLMQDMKVYQIATQIGYPNVDYFYSKFRRYVGMSPSEFRKKRD